MEAQVRLEGLEKRFGEVVAVRDVTATIAGGAFLTLLGASGSGKTTTLMMIAGFLEPTRGEIFVGDRRITRLPPQQLAFQHMLDTIRRGFERFGFVPVETPVFELSDVLLTKTGGKSGDWKAVSEPADSSQTQ